MVEVHDKRKRAAATDGPSEKERDESSVPAAERSLEGEVSTHQAASVVSDVIEPEHDYLEDLKRLQAEFDNYRKRHRDEQAKARARITAALLEGLLPVLDNFERAVEHGNVDSGIELVYKQLQDVLAQDGLEEVPAEGRPFDPAVHEAVDSVEDPSVDRDICKTVYRRGYRVGDYLIRPAMVVVARPPDSIAEGSSDALLDDLEVDAHPERDQKAG